MHNPSLTQKFALLILNMKKNLVSTADISQTAGLMIAALFDMDEAQVIRIGDVEKRILDKTSQLTVLTELPDSLAYLNKLYTLIETSKNKNSVDVISSAMMDLTDRTATPLAKDVTESLIQAGVVKSGKQKRFLRTVDIFTPDPEVVERLIQQLRVDLLEAETPEVKSVLLSLLLQKASMLNHYFSDYERKTIDARIKEFKKSEVNQKLAQIVDDIEAMYVFMFAVITAQ